VRALIAPFIIAPLLLGSLPAFAQGNPSAAQIINSLKPTGNLVQGGTRGIRLAAPSDAAAQPQDARMPQPSSPGASSPGAAMPVQQPRLASNRPVAVAPVPAPAAGPAVNLTVNFGTGSAELTPQAIRTLDELGRALASQDLAGYRFRIEGHTDTVGSRDYNGALSERRAQAVVDYVATKYGVAATRLQAVGMGDEGRLVQTPPQTAEPRNRRVQVINIGT
jgi:OmpA-OmpF porin, OOP family